MTDAQQSARNAAASVAYEHVGVSHRTCKDGWPSPIVGLIPEHKPEPELEYTVHDAQSALEQHGSPHRVVNHLGWRDLMERQGWRDQANCRDTVTDDWFPDKGANLIPLRRICDGCEVAAQCLAYALNKPERFGVFGGLSIKERQQVRRGAALRPLRRGGPRRAS